MKLRITVLNYMIIGLLILSALLTAPARPAFAQQPGPTSPDQPFQSLTSPEGASPSALDSAEMAATLAALPPLKAVLIVGAIDANVNGKPGPATQVEINNMELAATALQSKGVQVLKFYAPNDNWNNIVAATNGAHFLLYRGHGIYWNGNAATPEVGGFGLSDRMYSNDEIRNNFRLAPNSIVMLFACFATGSAPSDPGSITQAEARRRISQYSQPFFDLGAAGYYANWYGDAFQVFINNLFAGMTLGNAFKNYHDFESSKWAASTHTTNSNLPLWMSWEDWDDYPIDPPVYNNAFAGYADKTLNDLFTPTITLSSTKLALIAKPSSQPRTYKVTVQSNAGTSFSWVASPASGAKPAWVNYTPTTGANGAILNVTITPTSSTGKYQTSILVGSADGSAQKMLDITLITMADPKLVFLPSTIR